MNLILTRFKTSSQGTVGLLKVDEHYFYTIECPWHNNKRNISCIPKGKYKIKPRYSHKYKHHFMVENVMNRSYILMHPGNIAGDTSKGYKTHSNGCILVGSYFGKLIKQDAVLGSRIAIRKMNNILKDEEHTLTITGVV